MGGHRCGHPKTLMLFRLQPSTTKSRPPGPGPIRRREWILIAKKLLKDRQVILHTDGAKAYKLALSGVIHDNVVHKKKWLLVNGKQTWVRPHYTKLCTHTLPNGKKIRVKAGAHVIDRFWGHVRAYLKHAARRVGSCTLRRKIHAAHWTYRHKGQNLWSAAAKMLQDLS